MLPFHRTYFANFDDADPAGILFYGHFFKLAHKHLEAFLQTTEIGWSNWFDHAEWVVPIKSASVEFTAPIKAGEAFTIHLTIDRLGESSVTFSCLFQNESGDCARVISAHVFVDKKTKSKISIPPAIQQELSTLIQT